jgi:hypothetical protein
VAANNLAVCKIFQNKVGESIKLLEDLTRSQPSQNICESVVQNLVAMYDIHYCCNASDFKIKLSDFCAAHQKQSMNASQYVHKPVVKK